MDDVEDIAEAMGALLESFGHELRATPVMNGYDAARPIKARLPAWPYFAAVTGAAEDGVEAAMRQAGFDPCGRKLAAAEALLALPGVGSTGPTRGSSPDNPRAESHQETTPTKKPTQGPAFACCKEVIQQRILVPEKGVEPSTFSLRMSCSTN